MASLEKVELASKALLFCTEATVYPSGATATLSAKGCNWALVRYEREERATADPDRKLWNNPEIAFSKKVGRTGSLSMMVISYTICRRVILLDWGAPAAPLAAPPFLWS